MALILVSMALSCRSGVVDKSRYTLRQAGFRVLYMAPVYVAMEEGLFQKEGIDFSYTEIDSGALGVATVISGDVDISDIDPVNVARLRERGKSFIMFYNVVNRVTAAPDALLFSGLITPQLAEWARGTNVPPIA